MVSGDEQRDTGPQMARGVSRRMASTLAEVRPFLYCLCGRCSNVFSRLSSAPLHVYERFRSSTFNLPSCPQAVNKPPRLSAEGAVGASGGHVCDLGAERSGVGGQTR
ncbi:hypothetical protein EYF80_021005 [Liparis tanakae]|uniref:Uncharacterized protein n=1 Tax=Liparis tanakae TaxID=230148 RepID=A0A4Z2HSY0_9TELE|nr:hypothetical protein EYF80_021005 [Liparis tanakae]